MRVPDLSGMTLSGAVSLLEQSSIRWSAEEIRPPRDRRGEEEKGELRVLRAREEENGCWKLIVCKV